MLLARRRRRRAGKPFQKSASRIPALAKKFYWVKIT